MVPKSLSLSLPPRLSSAPPRAPLPPLPVAGSVTSPISPQQTSAPSAQPDPEVFRRRARATLVDVWRLYVISALSPQHLPAAGYAEWILIAMASKARAEIESIETAGSHRFGVSSTRAGGSGHKRTQSEGRNAFDFGNRMDDCESEQWHCRAPSPFPDMLSAEDTDRVVYPRREHGKEVLYLQSLHSTDVAADEWGVRYIHHPTSSDEANVFSVGYNGHNDSLLGEHFTVGDDWDDNERLTLELSRTGRHVTPGMYNPSSSFDDRHLHPADFGLDCSGDDDSGLANTAFDVSRCPLIPSDVNDDEESDDSQTSVRTPEDGEDLPRIPPSQKLQGSPQHATCFAPQPPLVSRVSSSRPRSRNASAQYSNVLSTSDQALYLPTFTPSSAHNFDCRDTQADELITSHIAYLERICTALEIVRSRAREEGWSLVRTTSSGAKNGWSDAGTERSLEIRAKRRAWSSGIKISAPYSTSYSARKVWDGGFSALRSSMRLPGATSRSTGILQVRGPIVPTGLSLGIPVRSSPLAMYAWGAEDGHKSTPRKYGILNSVHSTETIEGKRSSRVSFADSVTKLFPVCEDNEDSFEPIQVDAVGFPQVVPLAVSAEEPGCGFSEGLAEKEDDPFYFCPSWPRKRTTSMYVVSPTPSTPSSPVLPMFRCSSPSPYDQAAVSGDVPAGGNDKEGRLDASALLLQPLSSLSICSSPQSPSSRPPLTSNPLFVPRPRAVSLPTPGSYFNTNKTRRTSFNHKDEPCEDLSRVYASPPPEGPLVVSATPGPHEQHPRYAHVYSPIPAGKNSINASIFGRTGKEVVFEQAGSEFTVGIEVALGRAEEGRVVW